MALRSQLFGLKATASMREARCSAPWCRSANRPNNQGFGGSFFCPSTSTSGDSRPDDSPLKSGVCSVTSSAPRSGSLRWCVRGSRDFCTLPSPSSSSSPGGPSALRRPSRDASGTTDSGGDLRSILAKADGPSSSSAWCCSERSGEDGSETSGIVSSPRLRVSVLSMSSPSVASLDMDGLERFRKAGLPCVCLSESR